MIGLMSLLECLMFQLFDANVVSVGKVDVMLVEHNFLMRVVRASER